MKTIFYTAALIAGLIYPAWNNSVMAEEVKTKKVCKDTMDKAGKAVKNKDGSTKQTCKEIRVHKKHEGTAIPEKGAKK
jgi:acetylglutamate synthase